MKRVRTGVAQEPQKEMEMADAPEDAPGEEKQVSGFGEDKSDDYLAEEEKARDEDTPSHDLTEEERESGGEDAMKEKEEELRNLIMKPKKEHQTPWRLQKLDLWKYPQAMCLDGSPGSFYIQSSSNSKSKHKWVVHHQGGAWCALDVPYRAEGWKQVDHCLQRTSGPLGTSTKHKPSPDDNDIIAQTIKDSELTDDPKINPLMHDWNHVHVNYCDGGSFSGRNVTSSIVKACDANNTCGSKELHFKGNFVLEAVIETLMHEHALKKAHEVVIAGCGSGGLATYLHANQWRAALPKRTFVAALADSGFLLDWTLSTPEGESRDFGSQLRSVFHLHNVSGSISHKCAKSRTENEARASDCFFPEHGSSFISVPVFARQSMVDSFQLKAELGSDFEKMEKAELDESINAYRKYLALAMNMSLLAQPQNGAFVTTCQYHSGHWSDLVINGVHMNHAFSTWYSEKLEAWQKNPEDLATEGPSVRLWQDRDWPCPDCCPVQEDKSLSIEKQVVARIKEKKQTEAKEKQNAKVRDHKAQEDAKVIAKIKKEEKYQHTREHRKAKGKVWYEVKGKSEEKGETKEKAKAKGKAAAKTKIEAKESPEAKKKAEAKGKATAEEEIEAKEKAEARGKAESKEGAAAKEKAEAKMKAEASEKAAAKEQIETKEKAEATQRVAAKEHAEAKEKTSAKENAKEKKAEAEEIAGDKNKKHPNEKDDGKEKEPAEDKSHSQRASKPADKIGGAKDKASTTNEAEVTTKKAKIGKGHASEEKREAAKKGKPTEDESEAVGIHTIMGKNVVDHRNNFRLEMEAEVKAIEAVENSTAEE